MQFHEKAEKYSNMPRKPIIWVKWMGTSPRGDSPGILRTIHTQSDPWGGIGKLREIYYLETQTPFVQANCANITVNGVGDNPLPEQATILRWIRDGVSIF